MLEIPKAFFEKEIRLDHEVSEKFKHAWAIQLTVLNWVLEVAEKHGIKVWLDYGSLLGAVRHKGYVPWDDDIDICALRPDFMKLLGVLEKELPAHCRVRSLYTTPGYHEPKAFIACRDAIDVGQGKEESDITEFYFGCPYCTGIDLYPLDLAPRDSEQWELIRQVYIAVYDLAFKMDEYVASGEFEGYLTQIEEILHTQVKRDENLKNTLWRLADSVAMMTTKEEADHCLWYPDSTFRLNDMRRPLGAYDDTVNVDFEMLKAPIPAGFKDVLEICYGKEFMTPVKALPAHDYPFFKGQEELIRKYSSK